MRVAFLVSAFPAISETFILDQVTGLIDRGCEVTIFADEAVACPANHPEIDSYALSGVTHTAHLPKNHLWRPLLALRRAAANPGQLRTPHFRALNFLRHGWRAASLRLFLETQTCAPWPPFDILHCHFGPNGLRGLALRDIGALRGKLVTSFYGYDLSEVLKQHTGNPYAALLANSELSIAISEVMRRQLISLGCRKERAVVHPLGVNPNLFVSARRPDDGRVRILSIGRMVPKKGWEYGLRAVAAIASEVPGLEYVLIGDGPLRGRIEQQVADLGLRNTVTLPGWKSRPEVVAAMGQADILLAPSITSESGDQEGTPVVIMEAMASGLPVVSTFHTGIPEVVEHESSGLLVQERDVAGLSAALKFLAMNSGPRARMGQRGQSIIRERHDIRTLNDDLVRIYHELIALRK